MSYVRLLPILSTAPEYFLFNIEINKLFLKVSVMPIDEVNDVKAIQNFIFMPPKMYMFMYYFSLLIRRRKSMFRKYLMLPSIVISTPYLSVFSPNSSQHMLEIVLNASVLRKVPF